MSHIKIPIRTAFLAKIIERCRSLILWRTRSVLIRSNHRPDYKLPARIPLLFLACSLVALNACKPDKIEIEIYTSDIQAAAEGDLIEVPMTVEFSMLGDADDYDIDELKEISLEYLSADSEFTITDGMLGSIVSISTSIPMANKSVLSYYLTNNTRLAVIVVDGESVVFEPTQDLEKLDDNLSWINFMMGVEFPAELISIRIASDSRQDVGISATAVFSNNKAYLHLSEVIQRRESIALDFTGTVESVYSQIYPRFNVDF